MFIERVQIEEGFLHGLNIEFKPGLNVIIGGRGTGKTSLIELIRFCLDVPGYTQESSRRSRDHALSVLGSGQITVTLLEGERRITVTRSASENAPRSTGPYHLPIILSQTEIETVGLQPSGRLKLLDGFLGELRSLKVAESEAIAAVRSMTEEADAIRADIERFRDQVAKLPQLEEELRQLFPKEQKLAELSAETQSRAKQLNELSNTISKSAVAIAAAERFWDGTNKWRIALGRLLDGGPSAEPWPEDAGEDCLNPLQTRVEDVNNRLKNVVRELEEVEREARELKERFTGEKIAYEDQARQMRTQIETFQAGAGEIARQAQVLKEQKAQLNSLQAVLKLRERSLLEAIERRTLAMDELESIRMKRYQMRAEVADKLNKELGPRIQIEVLRGGQTEVFSAAVAEGLRGSGLKYGDLVTTIIEKLSPRDLLEVVENNDFETFSISAGTSVDRATKAITALKDADLGMIATVEIEDFVGFSLLHGSDHKDISELSTGQRCTVVLPLVLRHSERILIVDQPEDHIDNSFIVDTLIKSVNARNPNGQMIFSTHNANIPVIGNADLVVHMGSDGKRGFTLQCASLSDTNVIKTITSIMEGGVEAFEKRAKFYGVKQ